MPRRSSTITRPLVKLSWATLALAGSIAAAAHGQATLPPASQPTTPAEIQPGHPIPDASKPPGTGPQAAVPAPLPPGANPDTPGGSARSGLIQPPPAAGDSGINRGAPLVGAMPVIPPPGTAGGNTNVVPK